ncbi:hypothetical protein [Rhizobium leguminosarum]|uniref:hypothetical protein n=1 Tax=Rhizobium leguminosarum TaxID=384 RepID=UPI00143F59EE|nr:hypothetical protein [Rhizobium leguminosarum]NKK63045.1 hypothetical protein [Rhizobium leguminosarum bv. viciae]NKL08258.1 hypothetical protein [Rhizobium leguminosarum bv. viciae]NKL83001.1 hypothetical protein [Rhizobium leguminosarum bv. viciae]NKL93919.1 hypothetical protein [Rhizobium leguminosarum bv. viciae]NKM94108.1 hypothetical protein [Rhizobium leguminosarum bv. viciae]
MESLRADAEYAYGGTPNWYDVTLAGYNYVDDRCSIYFDSIFKLNRQREAAKSGISAFGQTTNAILGVTGATQLSMTVVAQAFGLASNLTDVVAGTYLYELPPATTKKFVGELARAYRDGTARQKGSIDSAPAAYGYIRGYLDLCLPATIEGELVEHVGSAVAVANPTTSGSGVDLRIASEGNLPLPRSFERPPSATTPLPRTRAPKKLTAEDGLSRVGWSEIQTLLCVEPADGILGKTTRQAIFDFYQGRGDKREDVLKVGGINNSDTHLLQNIQVLSKGKTCVERGVTNAQTVGQLSREQ